MNTFQELGKSGELGTFTPDALYVLRQAVQEHLQKYENFSTSHENSKRFIASEIGFLKKWLEVNTMSLMDAADDHSEL